MRSSTRSLTWSRFPMEGAAARLPALREFGYWMYRYRRTWRGSVVISVVNPLLFILAMGTGLGKLVNARGADSLHGAPYLHFVAPGLLAAAAMQTAFLEASGPVLQAAQPGGSYRPAVAAPMRPVDVFAGHLLFIAFRSAVSAAAVVAVAVAWGAVGAGAGLLLVPAAVLTGLAFAAPAAAFSVVAKRRASINAMFRFVVMPLYMFSGTSTRSPNCRAGCTRWRCSARCGTAWSCAARSACTPRRWRAPPSTSRCCSPWPLPGPPPDAAPTAGG